MSCTGDLDEACVRFESAAMAAGAIEWGAVAAEQHTHVKLVAFALQIFEKFVDPVEVVVAFP